MPYLGMRHWFFSDERMADAKWVARIDRCRARAMELRRTPKQIWPVVEGLLAPDPETRTESFCTLLLLEDAAATALCRALTDPRFVTPEARAYNGPWYHLAEILDVIIPAAAIEPLTRLLEHDVSDVRYKAALQLGKYAGAEGALAAVRRAVSDPMHHVRERALIGLSHAVRCKVGPRSALMPLFGDVLKVVDMPSVGGTEAPEVLLAIDPEPAAAELTRDHRLELGHPNLSSILIGLARKRVRVEPEKLTRLLASWKDSKVCHANFQGYALQLLAITGEPSAAKRIAAAIKSGDSHLRTLAADAESILKGVPDAYQVAIRAWGGPEDLHEGVPAQLIDYATAAVLRNEVRNGGFGQYFFNSYGGEAVRALHGLQAMGAVKTADLLRRAMSLFGNQGHAADRAARQEQLERLSGEELLMLDDAFYADPDRLDVLLARYAAKHRSLFTSSRGG